MADKEEQLKLYLEDKKIGPKCAPGVEKTSKNFEECNSMESCQAEDDGKLNPCSNIHESCASMELFHMGFGGFGDFHTEISCILTSNCGLTKDEWRWKDWILTSDTADCVHPKAKALVEFRIGSNYDTLDKDMEDI